MTARPPPTVLPGNRRQWLASVAGLSAALGWSDLLAQPSGPLEKSRISIAVAGKTAFYALPLTLAEQLGYFRAEGLELEISDFASGLRALQAVLGGAADVVSAAFEQTIHQQSKGQFLQAFVMQGRAPQIALGISTKTLPRYQSLLDLKGKKIGVSAPGSSTQMVAHLILSRAGLKTSDVSFISVGSAAGALAALRSGQIDAISNIDPVMTLLEQKGDIKVIADTRTLKGTQEVFGGPMPSACLFAAQEFVQKHPRTCQALTNAMVHALKWLQTAGPSDLIKTVPEAYLLSDRALYLAAFDKVREAFSPDGMMPEDGADTALRALVSFDAAIKPEKIDLAKTFTNEFARKAKTRFRA